MGCDIHFNVETRQHFNWEEVPGEYYDVRNYSLFGILAGVRRSEFTPIVEPRGLPDDCSESIRAKYDYGDHHCTYLTLQELMDYDWTQVVPKSGYVNAQTYHYWVEYDNGDELCPDGYQAQIFSSDAIIVSVDEMDARIAAVLPTDKHNLSAALPNVYTRIEWDEPYYMHATEFLSVTIPKLWRLAAVAGVQNVRVVFWFDN